LFDSLASGTTAFASAFAITQYVPVTVPGGTTTDVSAESFAFAGSGCTVRVPSRTSAASSVKLADR
jgi:hypothetical protein